MTIVVSALVLVALLGLPAYGFVLLRRIWRWAQKQPPLPSNGRPCGSLPAIAPVGKIGELEPKSEPGSLASSRDAYGV
jgi:hypothetical protein